VLPDILAKLRTQLPEGARAGWTVRVDIANTASIVEKARTFDLDLGLIEGPCHASELNVEPWLEDEMLIVAAPAHPVAQRQAADHRAVSLQTLRQESWLLRELGSGTRETVNQLLVPHLHELRAGFEFATSEAIAHAAAAGLGITCLSRFVVRDWLDSRALVALRTDLPRLTRRWYLVSHREKQRTRGLELLIARLRGSAATESRRARARAPRNRPV
jgi:DNA-binding transcriptional LysR family regulator